MSKEYQQPGEHSWCSDYAFAAMDLAKVRGTDSLSLLKALLTVEGSVVYEAFALLGLDAKTLRESLAARRREVGGVVESENWVVDKATRRSKSEGFPLSSDHLLEVIWDEDCHGARWLEETVDPEALEEAMNSVRYDDGEEAPVKPPPPTGAPAHGASPRG